jgi:hypothetical protein
MAVAARENGIEPRRVSFKGANLAFVRRDGAYSGTHFVTRDDEPARFQLSVEARPGGVPGPVRRLDVFGEVHRLGTGDAILDAV